MTIEVDSKEYFYSYRLQKEWVKSWKFEIGESNRHKILRFNIQRIFIQYLIYENEK